MQSSRALYYATLYLWYWRRVLFTSSLQCVHTCQGFDARAVHTADAPGRGGGGEVVNNLTRHITLLRITNL